MYTPVFKYINTLVKKKKENFFACVGSMLRTRRIRIRIHMFLGLMDPDPLVRCMDPNSDPDPSIIKPRIVRKTLAFTVLW